MSRLSISCGSNRALKLSRNQAITMSNVNMQPNQSTWRRIIIFLCFFIVSFMFIFNLPSRVNTAIQCGQIDIAKNYNVAGEVEISADGTTRVDRKPFFPFGFYHVSWGSTVEERRNHLREIADAGFNIIHASFKPEESLDDYEKFLDEANSLGVRVITEFGLEPKIDPSVVVSRFKHKPAVFGWNVADDAGVHKMNPINPQQVLSLHCRIKNIDPDHITYISGSLYKVLKFANSADAIGFQTYPIGHQPKQPISVAHKVIAKIVASVPQNRLVIANSQAFSRYYENSPVPTFNEVRNMTYQAIVAGAKGIIYYTYYDEGKWYLLEHPDLWQGIQSLVPEIKKIGPILLEGERRKVNTRTKNALSQMWTLEDRGLVIVINTSSDRSQEISLNLPTDSVRAAFANRSDDLKFENGKLSGVLPPLAVGVYSFKA